MAQFDKASKGLLPVCVRGLLEGLGFGKVRRTELGQPEALAFSQVQDGMVRAYFEGRDEPDDFVIEFATVPNDREVEQMFRGVLLKLAAEGRTPEAILAILGPKHRKELPSAVRKPSRLGTAAVAVEWRQVKLWELDAATLLATGNPHLAPLAILARHDGEPAALIDACKTLIAAAPADEQEDLAAITAILGTLRFDKTLLQRLLRSRTMLEIPFLTELEQAAIARGEARGEARGVALGAAKAWRAVTLRALRRRFGEVPAELREALEGVADAAALEALSDHAQACPTLDAFRAEIPHPPRR